MMLQFKKATFLIIILMLVLSACLSDQKKITFKTEDFSVQLDEKGNIVRFMDAKTETEHVFQDSLRPILSIRNENKILFPISCSPEDDTLTLNFENGSEAQVLCLEKQGYLSFELISLSEDEKVDLVIWGPYPLTIDEVIGETVGVVQGKDFAIGLQALNPKTLGGYPWNENDCMPQIDLLDQENYNDLSEEGKRYVLYRVEAAKPTSYGSSLQAYCRKRDKERVVENWNHDRYTASAYEDGSYIGSKIALFGVARDKILERIAEIEKAENLPHPMIDGKWGKTAIEASSAYMIMGFGEKDIEKAISYTKRAGLKYLYHDGPFENWGHFDLKEKMFPSGRKGLKSCVEKAGKEGIKVGLHTLSNFITTNDPYVTPIPDKRLAKVGSSVLSVNLDETQTEIPIADPDFFNQFKNNNLKTVMIEEELIRYAMVSEEEPWTLLDCRRGAFGTQAAPHSEGSVVSKLADHGYKVFLSEMDLGIEMAETLGGLYNECGLRQISFDGLEGNRSTGMGNYGEVLFTKAWYDKLNKDIQTDFIADASRTSHYFWHIYTRMNWGEPWYAGFRESQTEYRLKNQKYFKRNLMPGMLGWFKMTPQTSIEDIEWLLARSAAFDAGYAFVCNYNSLEENGNTTRILELIGLWEKARMQKLFNEEQKQNMEDINREFSLKGEGGSLFFYEVYSGKYNHEFVVKQPGEPTGSTFKYENKGRKQVMNFILQAIDGDISKINLEINNYKNISLPIKLKKGQIIKYTGSNSAMIYDNNWQIIKSVDIKPEDLMVDHGEIQLNVDCIFENRSEKPKLKIELRCFSEGDLIK